MENPSRSKSCCENAGGPAPSPGAPWFRPREGRGPGGASRPTSRARPVPLRRASVTTPRGRAPGRKKLQCSRSRLDLFSRFEAGRRCARPRCRAAARGRRGLPRLPAVPGNRPPRHRGREHLHPAATPAASRTRPANSRNRKRSCLPAQGEERGAPAAGGGSSEIAWEI